MKKNILGLILILAIGFAELVPNDIVTKVDQSVFEVVVPKIVSDNLTYEKPLPEDLIPYAIRKDNYYSIGSAFAWQNNTFISAAHVLYLGSPSQYAQIYIRDKEGKVYPVNTIVGYANNRDFIVFTVSGNPNCSPLNFNTSANLNEKVYAVGNALGQGTVIREGLLTSTTAEEENGEWQWLRFSAAASPGNSGGPLLNKDGQVIGIVVMKSENENLNYALPIKEIQASLTTNKGVFHQKLKYRLHNCDASTLNIVHTLYPLPQSYTTLTKILAQDRLATAQSMLATIVTENHKNFFPNGKKSKNLLYLRWDNKFPAIIAENTDKEWLFYYAEDSDKESVILEPNGKFTYGQARNLVLGYLEKPDNVSVQQLWNDADIMGKLLAKGVYLHRTVESERIAITSLAKPRIDKVHRDRFGRYWKVRVWALPFADEEITCYTLPVPEGMVCLFGMYSTDDTSTGMLDDFDFYTGYIVNRYYGTIAEWEEFYKEPAYLPDSMKNWKLSTKNGQLNFSNARVKVTYNQKLWKVTPRGDIGVTMGIHKTPTGVTWNMQSIIFGEDKDNSNHFSITRFSNPGADAHENIKSTWKKVSTPEYPYNAAAYTSDGRTYIYTLDPASKHQAARAKSSQIYTIGLGLDGKKDDRVVQQKLDYVLKNVTITEPIK